MVSVVWFKRDLRVVDHPALVLAADLDGPVIPLYIVEPEMWAQPDASARQWRFVVESLASLDMALHSLGAPLVTRYGEAVQVLESLRVSHNITTLISHEETGITWSYARDKRVAGWARANGVAWRELPQNAVTRRLRSRDGWSKARDRFMAEPFAPPKPLQKIPAVSEPLPEARALGLEWDPCPERQKGGRDAGMKLLASFLTERGEPYRTSMSSPLDGAQACSRLSPHLAWGTLSTREVIQTTLTRRGELNGAPMWKKSLKSFTSRLAWRDHFMQKLEDAPDLDLRCLHSAYEGLRPFEPNAQRIAAWAAGQTGLPFFDACMRFLQATGWLNFRMRSMVVAVASYHLWLDWRSTGPVLARLFTDYEPGIHWSQMQMQSGTTGINTLRIYNPIKQGYDQDPTGLFTRRWVPELTPVPAAYLQEPWRWPGAGTFLGSRYPAPIVDAAKAARAARDRVWAVRQTPGFYSEAQGVVTKHASRKDRSRQFTRDPVRKPKPNPQLSFDL